MNKIIKFLLVTLKTYVLMIILFLWIVSFLILLLWTEKIDESLEKIDESFEKSVGTRWAVLLAGSKGYQNYRHQADVCHAYQIFKNGGLKDENIVVFMYDDIAFHEENPRKGIIINSPAGADVYHGVPKDYTGEDVTVGNFLAALLGNKNAVKGGSGKVVDSGPNDRIFVYYSGHGAYGLVTMPTKPFMYANDLIEVLKKKHAAGSYKGLVFYLEACKSGSIFQGLLPLGLDIYATTACNTHENSYATYCPGVDSSLSDEYTTCLGDLYSITWMEDCDVHNLKTETLKQQYRLVKKRASSSRSHVMEYGDLQISMDKLDLYFGTNPANENFTFIESNTQRPSLNAVNQWDADLLHFSLKFQKAPEGSDRKIECKKQLAELLAHGKHIDASFKLLEKVLSGLEKVPEVLNVVRPTGKPLVDDWDCLKTFVRTFETHCGSLSEYGMKHMRSIANFCNAGITKEQMIEASSQACPICPSNSWSSNCNGFSA